MAKIQSYHVTVYLGEFLNKGNAIEAEVVAIRDLEKRIGGHLNSRVSIKHSTKKGKITIEYFGNEDLERILEKIGVQ